MAAFYWHCSGPRPRCVGFGYRWDGGAGARRSTILRWSAYGGSRRALHRGGVDRRFAGGCAGSRSLRRLWPARQSRGRRNAVDPAAARAKRAAHPRHHDRHGASAPVRGGVAAARDRANKPTTAVPRSRFSNAPPTRIRQRCSTCRRRRVPAALAAGARPWAGRS